MGVPVALPILWAAWAVGPVPLGTAGTLFRLGTRLVVWGHDPADLVPGGGAVGASFGLGLALVVVFTGWVAGLASERRRVRRGGRAGHRLRTGAGRRRGRAHRDGDG